MARTKPNGRIVLQLDPRIALEAILLNRLERTPATRRQEWLRCLLLVGFRSECDVLRGVTESQRRCMTIPISTWNERTTPTSSALRRFDSAVVASRSMRPPAGNKRFAALARVIG